MWHGLEAHRLPLFHSWLCHSLQATVFSFLCLCFPTLKRSADILRVCPSRFVGGSREWVPVKRAYVSCGSSLHLRVEETSGSQKGSGTRPAANCRARVQTQSSTLQGLPHLRHPTLPGTTPNAARMLATLWEKPCCASRLARFLCPFSAEHILAFWPVF